MLLQLLANGLALGAAYALVALGFVLVVNATRSVNFAQGELVVAGGFVAVVLASLPGVAGSLVPGLLLLPLVVVLMAGLGLLASLVAYFPLRDRPTVSVFVSTIAFGIVLQNTIHGIFGPQPRAGPPLVAGGTLEAGGLMLDRQAVAIVSVAAILVAGVHLTLAKTQFGRRLRAAAQDPEMARAVGIPVNRMVAVTFALSTALAGIAGLLLANRFFISPDDGTDLMIKAYIAVVIGGWGSVGGAVAGAMLIALFEVGVAAWLSSPGAEAGLYLALLAILFLRPQGLFGEAVGRRA